MGNHGPDDYLRPEYVKTENGVDMIVENKNPLILDLKALFEKIKSNNFYERTKNKSVTLQSVNFHIPKTLLMCI